MRTHFVRVITASALLWLAVAVASLWAQEDFAEDFTPTITFAETRFQGVRYDAESEYYDRYYTTATTSVSCRASMQGVDLATIDADTSFALSVGAFSMQGVIGDSPGYAPGEKTIVFPIDADGDDAADDGNLTIRYSATEVTFTLTVNRDTGAGYSPVASSLESSAYAPNEYRETVKGGFEFAGCSLTERNVYVVGTRVQTYSKTVGAGTDSEETFEDLADVAVKGASDDTPPAVVFQTPAAGAKVHAAAQTVTLTVSDETELAGVQIQLNGEDWTDATLQDDGRWTFEIELVKGANTLSARATDVDGNERTTTVRTLTFAPQTLLTVDAAGTGAGKVTAPFFPTFDYAPGTASPVRTAVEEEDKLLKITATPGVNSVFDGWTSNVALTTAQASSPVIEFTLVPGLMLTAHFIPNPFLKVKGVFSGLITAEEAAERGFFTAKLDAKGAFTGRITIGGLSLPLRGKFSNDGHFSSQVKKGGKIYTVSLQFATLGDGAAQIIGSVRRGSLSAAITADRAEFDPRAQPAPQAGGYSVQLSPAAENTDVNYPAGIGFGKVAVAKTGVARFTGVLGDGTRLSFGTTVSKGGVWPFFALLYRKAGSISGAVAFADLAETDLAGTVDWFKPARVRGKGPFREGFTGRSRVAGVKYPAKPAAAGRLILKADGQGVLALEAPETTKHGFLAPALVSDDAVSLSPGNVLTVPVDARALTFKLAPATGLFTGRFVEQIGGKRETITFGGVVLPPKGAFPGAGAGNFIRGTRTGAVTLGAASL